MPGLPVLGAVPESTTSWLLLLALLPVALGALAGWIARSRLLHVGEPSRPEPVDRTPVWMMRQAGRYLPEYRATRERAGSFLKLCMAPELACEVTLQPLERFPLDAAILFSDILTIPHALGLGLQFETGEGPRIERPVRSKADVEKLGVPDPNVELRYVMDAVSLIRKELNGRVQVAGEPVRQGECAMAASLGDLAVPENGQCLLARPCVQRA